MELLQLRRSLKQRNTIAAYPQALYKMLCQLSVHSQLFSWNGKEKIKDNILYRWRSG